MNEILKKIQEEAIRNDIPIMKDDGIAFIIEYIKMHEEIRDILEAGTAVGYSAIQFASIRWDMNVDTIEIDPSLAEVAENNFVKCGVDSRVKCYNMDAMEYDSDKVYDLIFIDAAKSQYKKYLEHFYHNSHKGTVFIFDNLAFHGMVDNPEKTTNRSTLQMTRKIKKFRDQLEGDPRFDTEFYLDIGDGIAISIRLSDN